MIFKVDPAPLWAPEHRPKPKGERYPKLRGTHTCGCGCCDARFLPRDLDEVGFFSVRRGDYMLQPMLHDRPLNNCIELQTGKDGWALIVSEPPHVCANCIRCGDLRQRGMSHYCVYLIESDELSVVGLAESSA